MSAITLTNSFHGERSIIYATMETRTDGSTHVEALVPDGDGFVLAELMTPAGGGLFSGVHHGSRNQSLGSVQWASANKRLYSEYLKKPYRQVGITAHVEWVEQLPAPSERIDRRLEPTRSSPSTGGNQ